MREIDDAQPFQGERRICRSRLMDRKIRFDAIDIRHAISGCENEPGHPYRPAFIGSITLSQLVCHP
ncbi:hypothetical protein NRB_06890 [Novosphingobium sp. 11B]